MSRLLVVVDMQNDFVTGALGSPEAQAVVPLVARKVREAEEGTLIVLTQDTHGQGYLRTQEGLFLPVPHCIEGTWGQGVCPDVQVAAGTRAVRLHKSAFASVHLVELVRAELARHPVEQIELCGVCTDICVVSNALLLKAHFPEILLAVDGGCCAGTSPEAHQAALTVLRSCQVSVSN